MKKMRFAAAALALLMTLGFASCNVEDPTMVQSSASSASVSSQDSSTAQVKPGDYSDDLDGLAQYLIAGEVISGEYTEMEAGLIGAAQGRKYTVTVNKKSFSVEIYEYDVKNLSDDAKTVLDAVDADGKFEILNTQVEAVHSGKYLLIYGDTAKDSANTQRKEAAVSLFNAFGDR